MTAILLDLLRGVDASPRDWRIYVDLIADCFRDHEQENLADRMASISRSPFEPYTEGRLPTSVRLIRRCARVAYADYGPIAVSEADNQVLQHLIDARMSELHAASKTGQEKS